MKVNSHLFYILARLRVQNSILLIDWYVGECEDTIKHFKQRKSCRFGQWQGKGKPKPSKKDIEKDSFISKKSLDIGKFETPWQIEQGLLNDIKKLFKTQVVENKNWNKASPCKHAPKYLINLEDMVATEGKFLGKSFLDFVNVSLPTRVHSNICMLSRSNPASISAEKLLNNLK